jgi:hypothetical protein
MEQKKKRRIQWFLKFANMDFSSETGIKKIKLVQEIQFVFDNFSHEELSRLVAAVADPQKAEVESIRFGETLQRIQRRIRSLVQGIENKLSLIRNEYGGENEKCIPIREVANLCTLAGLKNEVITTLTIKDKPIFKQGNDAQVNVYWPKKALAKTLLDAMVTPAGDDDGLLFYLVQALDGASLTALGRCQECGNLFLQSGRKPRFFCSDRCRTRKGVRDRYKRIREKGGQPYELELKRGKERAIASYKKKTGKPLVVKQKIRVIRIPKKKREEGKGTDN